VLKVAVVAAAAELLRLAGESVDGVMPLNGNDKETLTAGGAPGVAPASCPCRCADRWPWRWCSRRRFFFPLPRRPAEETSQSDETHIATQNRKQAHVGLLLLAYRHRLLADIMRPGCFWELS
jgi:hypothetical protein